MPFRITAEFLETLDGSPQEWDELKVLAKRAEKSRRRINAAVDNVKARAGTLNNLCFPLSLAFIEPECITGTHDLNGIRMDHKEAQKALIIASSGKRVVTPVSAVELYENVARSDFIGGIVYIAGSMVGPDAEPNSKHAALLIPGLGGLMEEKPESLAQVLSCVGYVRSVMRPDMPNAVKPSVPLNEAEKITGTDLPLIQLYFKQ